LRIKEVDSSDEQYISLCKDRGTIFNSREWLDIFKDNIKVLGVFDKGDNLIAGFHLYFKKSKGIKFVMDPPFTPLIGPMIPVKSEKYIAQLNFQKSVLTVISDYLAGFNSRTLVSCSFSPEINDTQPFIWNSFNVTPNYTYIIDLKLSEPEVWELMESEKKATIRKAEKDGVEVRLETDLKVVYELVLMTFSRQYKKVDKEALKKILFEFANSNNSFAYCSYFGGQPVAVVFCVYDNNTVYNLLAGYDNKNKHRGAGAAALWQAVKHAQVLERNHFDFEGSMQPQIERYFRGFGGRLVTYYKISKAKSPLKLLLSLVNKGSF